MKITLTNEEATNLLTKFLAERENVELHQLQLTIESTPPTPVNPLLPSEELRIRPDFKIPLIKMLRDFVNSTSLGGLNILEKEQVKQMPPLAVNQQYHVPVTFTKNWIERYMNW